MDERKCENCKHYVDKDGIKGCESWECEFEEEEMSVCKYLSQDGICVLHSEENYQEPCHEGPCTDY